MNTRYPRRSIGTQILAATLATLLFWLSPASLTVAQDGEEPARSSVAYELSDEARGSVRASDLGGPVSAEVEDAVRSAVTPVGDIPREGEPAETPEGVTPIALPGGDTRSAVSTQAISLPNAEGSIEGMGESFAPILSSGTATFTVPIAVAPGRAGVQPSFSLSYSSTGGNGPIGVGWGMGVPFISRQTDRGLPRYVDREEWHPEEDRFIYNGGQELVPVDSNAMARVDQQAVGSLGALASRVPSDVAGWQQYRARVEGGFMRFFRSPDSRRWVVQSKDGTRFDFGILPVGEGPGEAISASARAVEQSPEATATEPRIYRWMLTRMSDPHGSVIWYLHRQDGGMAYCEDVYYVSPSSCAGGSTPAERRRCVQPLGAYGARVHFVWSSRDDVFSSYVSGYRIDGALRLSRVEVTAHDDTAAARALVRRYHLTYASTFHSQLASVQVEGRPLGTEHADWGVEIGARSVPESALSDAIVGPLLPAMRFGYTSLGTSGDAVPGFGALSPVIRDITAPPPHSVDEARSDLLDVNSDGLPDLVVTDPARYRTASGEPAVGVFFNGFSGSATTPAAPGTFSDVVPMAMPGALSGVLNLGNLNLVPMDMDGDGRTDLLHMPRLRTYGWFAATRRADPSTGPAFARPAQQGWRWTYAEVTLPSSDLDPRVDFGRDGEHLQTLDVNNDHLIDIVRTTGTVMQTWLNLGWLPGGDGRFGSYRYSGTTPVLSTAPIESCLLQDGLPLDFEDPEVRFADMNGDGITDIVRIRRGRVVYWPGRGVGAWGEGSSVCARGAGAGRAIVMSAPPAELNPELDGVQFADVDGDGASDVIQIGFDRIDVWWNRAGRSFTRRTIIERTPAAPAFAPRTRLVDIDGSGTLDVVYANGLRWQYVDLLASSGGARGQRLRLLNQVDNGLGALTTLEYDTSARDYLEDLADAEACTGTDCFVWGRVDGEASRRLRGDPAAGVPRRAAPGQPDTAMYHGAGSPVISTVVRRVTTSDRFDALSIGREAQVTETQFAYHDGYYEGIEQEFRGFGAADSLTLGDDNNPSVRTRTFFHQGRRPQAIADDRLAWSEEEALKGREYLTEVFDLSGVFQSTAHATLTSRTLSYGLDGRPIQYAFVSQSDELRYDTAPFEPSSELLEVPSILRETVDAAGAISTPTLDRTRMVAVRGARPARIQITYDVVDNLGHVRQQSAHGRVAVAGTMGGVDEPIVTVMEPVLLPPGESWIWRTRAQHVLGPADTPRLGDSVSAYDPVTGDLLRATQVVTSPRTYVFEGEPVSEGGAPTLTQLDEPIVASTAYDPWGNALAQCAGADLAGVPAATPPSSCFRYGVVQYDSTYQHFADRETVFVGRALGESLSTEGQWDRGLGVLLRATDPNALVTEMGYDSFGRVTAVAPPAVAGCEAYPGRPSTRIRYALTTNPAEAPVSRVFTTTELDCAALGADTLESVGFVDGLGRVRATLATGDEEHAWIRSALSIFDRKGAVRRAWQADFYDGDADTYASVLRLPGARIPSSRAVHDAFGRAIYVFAEDGAITTTSYHALSTDVCDPLDNDPASMHFGTCTTARSDGFGRVIDQILRNRQPGGGGGTEQHRLFTYYRQDNAVLHLVRSESSAGVRPTLADATDGDDPFVHREFVFDSIGRRIGSFDPDTDDRDNPDPASSTWRYLFNRVGDLVAVRDPRGCGQNFYYDVGGRLAGEAYVSCLEAQTSSADLPTETRAGLQASLPSEPLVSLDVLYHYDAYPSWASTLVPPGVSGTAGRATGVTDRGQRAAIAYDDRGNAIWTARQMALIADPLTLLPGPTGDGTPIAPRVIEQLPAMSTSVAYDTAHTYERTASFDHAGRPTHMALPRDPDFVGSAPLITGALTYNRRGLPATASLAIDGDVRQVVRSIHYLRDGLVDEVTYGDAGAVLTSSSTYDARRRPVRMAATRTPDLSAPAATLGAVSVVADQELVWDEASNLIAIRDHRDPSEWPAGHRPQSAEIQHDSLYRVVSALFHYTHEGGTERDPITGSDASSDWRDAQATIRSAGADPMRTEPAPMVSTSPPTRVRSLTWEWDWLGNMVEWTDDQQSFYERSLGDIISGRAVRESGGVADRPSALYLASNIPSFRTADVPDGAGWLELNYGAGGNVTTMTVHGSCEDVRIGSCIDTPSADRVTRATALRAGCACAVEQHYEYRWDELDRIAEARRWDRDATATTSWTFAVRQRYRYDGANVRTVKQTLGVDTSDERIALYVYAGDFERRGMVRAALSYQPADSPGARTETQYLVAGARLVWMGGASAPDGIVDADHRLTVNVSDLLQTTTGVVDLESGALTEVSTYYPNGARETMLLDEASSTRVASEPMGFTGKEGDDEVGLVYFGERYLIARVARWASADPLHVHASGGGEALNSYHYVSGNLLAARDPIGLLGFSFRDPLETTGFGVSASSPHRTQLRAATWEMVREMRVQLYNYFGIRTGVRGEGGDDILDLRTIDDEGLHAATRMRVEDGMRRRGWSSDEVRAGLADWDRARTRLVETIASTMDVEVTTRNTGGTTLYTWETARSATTGRILNIYVNPLTYPGRGRMEASSYGASVAMGPIFSGLLHEPSHGDLRAWGDPPTGCFLEPCDTNAGNIEDVILGQTDRILEILGLPRRVDYGATSPPPDSARRDSADPADRTVPLSDGETATYPIGPVVRPDLERE